MMTEYDYARTTTVRRKSVDGMDAFLKLLGFLALIPLATIYHGWVIKVIWNWFIPTITSWPRLGIAQAIGISCLIGLFRSHRSDDSDSTGEQVIVAVLMPLFALLIAWIAHNFVS